MNPLLRVAIVGLSVAVLPGCIIARRPVYYPVHTASQPVAAAPAESCPPGHRWSDGRCHSTGKGRDPAKHHGKGHGHDHDD